MATYGLDKPYYAVITEDASGIETYGTPAPLAKAISAEINIETTKGDLFADDHLAESIEEFVSGTIKLGVDNLTPAVIAALVGATVDSKGVVVQSGEDVQNYVAIGFRALQPGGTYVYYWLYRVKFAIPSSSLATKNNSITFNTPTIEGTIFRRNKPDSRGKHPFMAIADQSAGGTDATTITNWFNSVFEPTFTAQGGTA